MCLDCRGLFICPYPLLHTYNTYLLSLFSCAHSWIGMPLFGVSLLFRMRNQFCRFGSQKVLWSSLNRIESNRIELLRNKVFFNPNKKANKNDLNGSDKCFVIRYEWKHFGKILYHFKQTLFYPKKKKNCIPLILVRRYSAMFNIDTS